MWFVVGILITFSPEFGKVLGIKGVVNAGAAVAFCYGGLVLGDIVSGLLSQLLKSRLKVVGIYLLLSVFSISCYFLFKSISLQLFYIICAFMGFSVGYWVIFMTIATEQFGTNIRATVTTTVPNFVRGAVVPLTLLFQYLRHLLDNSLIYAGIAVGSLCLLLAFWSLSYMIDTFGKDLDFQEDI